MISSARADSAGVLDGASGISAANTSGQELYGPIQEYETRVQSGKLRDDAHQRGNTYIYTCVFPFLHFPRPFLCFISTSVRSTFINDYHILFTRFLVP